MSDGRAVSTVAKVVPLRSVQGDTSARMSAPDAPGASNRTLPAPPAEAVELLDQIRRRLIDDVGSAAHLLRRRLAGDYEIDEFGYDGDFTQNVWYPLLRPLYRKWFRVEIRGIEHLPASGGALVASNHAGVIPIDAMMLAVGVHDEHPQNRLVRMLVADFGFEYPGVSVLIRRTGNTLACQSDAELLLNNGDLVGVFPEGFKGIGKPFSERYKLQRFGRGGFVSAAMRTGAPIIPCSIVGSEEIYPKIGELSALARLLGAPYFPITPTFPHLGPLGLVPLPSKWLIEFGPPIHTADYPAGAAEDPMELFEITDHVRETIQQNLYRLLARRRTVFF